VLRESKRDEEERWIAIGEAGGRIVAVIFTLRPTNIRIISARRARKMKNERTVVRRWGDRRKGRTDWAAFDALTDQEIDASITSDPDWQEFKDLDWSEAVLVIPPKKKAISIRVDEDVLDYFKKEGTGYQRRMNAVLRSYMQQMSKAKKRA
jgi:uncharacterized protein (DUF4415 family)